MDFGRGTLPLITAIVVSLGPLMGAEIGVRTLIATGRLPDAPARNEPAEVSIEQLERSGPVDVLIVGTSMVRSGIDPAELAAALAASGVAADVRNIGIGGLDLVDQLLLIDVLHDRGLLPEVAVLGVSTVGMTAGQAEPGWLRESTLGRYWRGCEGVARPDLLLDCALGQVSALWRWRGEPDRIVGAIVGGTPDELRVGDHLLRPDGFMAGPPRSIRRLERLLPDALARLSIDAVISEHVLGEYADVIEALEDAGVTVVPIFLPYTDLLETAMQERNPAWRDERSASLQRMEDATGVDIVEVEYGPWFDRNSRYDLRHLSRQGAIDLTRQLWETPEFRERLVAAVS